MHQLREILPAQRLSGILSISRLHGIFPRRHLRFSPSSERLSRVLPIQQQRQLRQRHIILQRHRLEIALEQLPVAVLLHDDPILRNHLLQRLAPLLTELLRPRNRRREHETILRRIH